jgi:antitoxin component of MazEF toxin-antitoxin module
MKKQTKITTDKKQVRVTIPKEIVTELKITKVDEFEWKMNNNSLTGRLVRK